MLYYYIKLTKRLLYIERIIFFTKVKFGCDKKFNPQINIVSYFSVNRLPVCVKNIKKGKREKSKSSTTLQQARCTISLSSPSTNIS